MAMLADFYEFFLKPVFFIMWRIYMFLALCKKKQLLFCCYFMLELCTSVLRIQAHRHLSLSGRGLTLDLYSCVESAATWSEISSSPFHLLFLNLLSGMHAVHFKQVCLPSEALKRLGCAPYGPLELAVGRNHCLSLFFTVAFCLVCSYASYF